MSRHSTAVISLIKITPSILFALPISIVHFIRLISAAIIYALQPLQMQGVKLRGKMDSSRQQQIVDLPFLLYLVDVLIERDIIDAALIVFQNIAIPQGHSHAMT